MSAELTAAIKKVEDRIATGYAWVRASDVAYMLTQAKRAHVRANAAEDAVGEARTTALDECARIADDVWNGRSSEEQTLDDSALTIRNLILARLPAAAPSR